MMARCLSKAGLAIHTLFPGAPHHTESNKATMDLCFPTAVSAQDPLPS